MEKMKEKERGIMDGLNKNYRLFTMRRERQADGQRQGVRDRQCDRQVGDVPGSKTREEVKQKMDECPV